MMLGMAAAMLGDMNNESDRLHAEMIGREVDAAMRKPAPKTQLTKKQAKARKKAKAGRKAKRK